MHVFFSFSVGPNAKAGFFLSPLELLSSTLIKAKAEFFDIKILRYPNKLIIRLVLDQGPDGNSSTF